MSTIYAPNLQTYAYVIAPDSYILFAEDRHRTQFTAQVTTANNADMYLWVGKNPSATASEWIRLDNEGAFSAGLYGPIYLAQVGVSDGKITVLSSIVENPTASTLLTALA